MEEGRVGRGVEVSGGSLSPSHVLLELGAQQDVTEQEDVSQLPVPLHQFHHQDVPQQLPALEDNQPRGQNYHQQPLTPRTLTFAGTDLPAWCPLLVDA